MEISLMLKLQLPNKNLKSHHTLRFDMELALNALHLKSENPLIPGFAVYGKIFILSKRAKRQTATSRVETRVI